jgi:subtilisin family serine protease
MVRTPRNVGRGARVVGRDTVKVKKTGRLSRRGDGYPGKVTERHPKWPRHPGRVVHPRLPNGPGLIDVTNLPPGGSPINQVQGPNQGPNQANPNQPGNQNALRNGFNPPPAGETRFVPNEILLNIPADISLPALNLIAQRNRLTQIETRNYTLPQRRLARVRINDLRPVGVVILALQREAGILGAQPNYYYTLEQGPASAAPDSTQYAIGKMKLSEAHALARGDSIRVAIIDTTIDTKHPDLAGTVSSSFNAIGKPDKPHSHGTGIAGVIAAHGKLMGVAPAVNVLAIAAFTSLGSKGTSLAILDGLEHAGTSDANVVNMSFAGPSDPEMQLKIAALRNKGIVLVAAAGNAGPKSEKLFPAAYPEVIAVTATDADDKLFDMANRGNHIALAAPGVSIFVAAPNDSYNFQSGTSFAAAQVSGVAALILARNRKLDPLAVRRILTSTARDLGPPGPDDQFGSGLVDALAAVESAAPKISDVSGAAQTPAH